MRSAAVLVVLAWAGCSAKSAPPAPGDASGEARRAAPDPDALVAPGLRLPAGVAPIGYRLVLDLDPGADTFRGKAELKLLLDAPHTHVWLHAVDLELETIEVEAGGRARAGAVAPVTGDEMIAIDLGGRAERGMLTLRIDYVGKFHDQDQLGLFRAKDRGKSYVFSQLEAVQARKVMPCLDEPQWKIPWQVSVDIPAGMIAAGNAPIASQIDHADGRTVRFAATEPLPSYLIAIAVGPFATFPLGTVGANRIPLRVIAPAGTPATGVGYVRAMTPKIVRALEAYFARPMPYAKLDLVAIPSFPGAMENPGLVTFDRDLLLVGAGPNARAGFVELVAHELAHQWFGNLVTLRWWDDLWLNESFASWMGAKVAAELAPARDDATAVHGEIETAMAMDLTPTVASLRRDIRTNQDIEGSFDAIAYEKGFAVIAMFEAWIGEAALRDALRTYIAEHAGGVSDSTELLAMIERTTDPGVRAAFASFVDQPGVPLVTIDRRCTADGAAIVLSQQRLVPLGTPAAPAAWQIPVCVRFPATLGRPVERCALLGAATGEIAVPDGACPAWIVGNAGDRGYYRASVAGELVPPLGELTPRERLGLVGGISALIDAGHGDPAAVGEIVPILLASREPRDELVAIELIEATRSLVPDARLDAWKRWVHGLLGPAPATGQIAARAARRAAARSLRVERIELAAFALGDRGVQADARARADAWLAGDVILSGDELELVLSAAAVSADRAFADTLLARAATMPAGIDRTAVLAALGQTADVDASAAALQALVDPAFPSPQELAPIIEGLAARAPTRAALLALYADKKDVLINKLPRTVTAAETLIAPFAAVCDAVEKQRVVAALTPVAAAVTVGPETLAETVAAIDRCIARRAALGPKLDRVLGP